MTSLSGSSISKEIYSRLYIEYLNGKLSIFIPYNEYKKLLYYATQLLESLVTSLEIKDPTAHSIFTIVLQVLVEIVDGIWGIYGVPKLSELDPVTLVIINDSESAYEDALEEVFILRALIAWGSKD